jgi:hypothetical protein
VEADTAAVDTWHLGVLERRSGRLDVGVEHLAKRDAAIASFARTT